MQRVSENTRKEKNILELIFTNSEVFGDPNVFPTKISDHDIIEWTINLRGIINGSGIELSSDNDDDNGDVVPLGVSDFRLLSDKTNWDAICSKLQEKLQHDMSELNVTEQLDHFY